MRVREGQFGTEGAVVREVKLEDGVDLEKFRKRAAEAQLERELYDSPRVTILRMTRGQQRHPIIGYSRWRDSYSHLGY